MWRGGEPIPECRSTDLDVFVLVCWTNIMCVVQERDKIAANSLYFYFAGPAGPIAEVLKVITRGEEEQEHSC